MYRCQDCDLCFSETGVKIEPEKYEYWGATITHDHHYECCPFCGSEDFIAYQEEENE